MLDICCAFFSFSIIYDKSSSSYPLSGCGHSVTAQLSTWPVPSLLSGLKTRDLFRHSVLSKGDLVNLWLQLDLPLTARPSATTVARFYRPLEDVCRPVLGQLIKLCSKIVLSTSFWAALWVIIFFFVLCNLFPTDELLLASHYFHGKCLDKSRPSQ